MSHTFVIANRGRQALMITKVKPNCAWTATAYDKTIPLGVQGTISLAIKPFWVHGNFAKKTTVTLNDPDHKKVVFTLKRVSRPLIDIQPGQVIRFKGKPGEVLYRQVVLTSNLPEPWEISRYTTNVPQFIDVTLRAAKPGGSYVVEVRPNRQEPGNYRGAIELFTTVPKRPRLVLRVFGEVLPP